MFHFLKKKRPEPFPTPPVNGARDKSLARERETNILYSLGNVIPVKPADRFDLNSQPEGYYLIAKGSASLLVDDRTELQSIGEGQGLFIPLFPESIPCSLSLRSPEGFKLVHLSGAAFKNLGTPLKAEIDQCTSRLAKKIKQSLSALEPSREAPGEYIRSRLKMERRALLDRYESSEFLKSALDQVKSLPVTTQRFIGLSLSESASNAEITAFIKNSPSLATQVLRTVNSSFHGLRNKVTDIHYAVLYLGLSQIFQIVVAAGLQNIAGQSAPLTNIYNHSVIISNIASLLSAAGGKKPSPIVATIGILHDVGEVFKTLMKANPNGLDVLIDHLSGPKLGSMLLSRWGIPEPICKAIELQEESLYSMPEEIDDPYRNHAACLHLAHRICDFVNRDGLPTDPLSQSCANLLGFGGMSLEQLVRLYIIPELRANTNKLPIEVQVFFSV